MLWANRRRQLGYGLMGKGIRPARHSAVTAQEVAAMASALKFTNAIAQPVYFYFFNLFFLSVPSGTPSPSSSPRQPTRFLSIRRRLNTHLHAHTTMLRISRCLFFVEAAEKAAGAAQLLLLYAAFVIIFVVAVGAFMFFVAAFVIFACALCCYFGLCAHL